MEHGAIQFRECAGDDLKPKVGVAFPRGVRARAGETVFFSYIVYRSKAHRNRANKKVMADPRLKGGPKEMPFDYRRMMFGGFRVVVDL